MILLGLAAKLAYFPHKLSQSGFYCDDSLRSSGQTCLPSPYTLSLRVRFEMILLGLAVKFAYFPHTLSHSVFNARLIQKVTFQNTHRKFYSLRTRLNIFPVSFLSSAVTSWSRRRSFQSLCNRVGQAI
ncbi:hypothetical protein YC2023_079743 [Brassica napus]